MASSTWAVKRPSSSFSGARPMLQRDEPVDVLVVALRVERRVAGGDVALLQHVEAGEPRRRQRREGARGGVAQRVVDRRRRLRLVSTATATIGADASAAARRRELVSPCFRSVLKRRRRTRPERVALEPLRARGELDLIVMARDRRRAAPPSDIARPARPRGSAARSPAARADSRA